MDWDSLADDAYAASKRGNGCGVNALLDTLDAEAKRSLIATMGRPELTHTGIVSALKKRGHVIGYSVMQRHRVGKCACAAEDN